MAFKLDDLIIDRIQVATAEDSAGNVLFTLTQLQEASISISAESNDVTDRDGNLIKRFWRAKTGEFTATNALININVLGQEAGGDGKVVASDSKAVTAPGIMIVKEDGAVVDLPNAIDVPHVYGLEANGTLGNEFTTNTETKIAWNSETKKLTLPVSTAYEQYLVRYNRTLTSGAVQITNQADKFPGTIRLILKVLCVDPCEADVLRAAYIDIPSFQISPEAELSLNSESQTLDFSGQLQVQYCNPDKPLYHIYVIEEDRE